MGKNFPMKLFAKWKVFVKKKLVKKYWSEKFWSQKMLPEKNLSKIFLVTFDKYFGSPLPET